GCHGRSEVRDVEALQEGFGQARLREVHDDATAFLTKIGGNTRVGELDDDAARSVGTAAKIDVPDRIGAGTARWRARRRRSGSPRRGRLASRRARTGTHRDHNRVAAHFGCIRPAVVAVQHYATLSVSLRYVHRFVSALL